LVYVSEIGRSILSLTLAVSNPTANRIVRVRCRHYNATNKRVVYAAKAMCGVLYILI